MQPSSILERRLHNEWRLLNDLSDCNPGRIAVLQLDGYTIRLHLHGPSARPVHTVAGKCDITEHAVRIDFPVHFPAVPMEMFLETPVVHPNIHPETGFVCLWDRHRVSNTVEHAMHKLAAMLSGHLRNTAAHHVMQPEACDLPILVEAMPLVGVRYDPGPITGLEASGGIRRRLL